MIASFSNSTKSPSQKKSKNRGYGCSSALLKFNLNTIKKERREKGEKEREERKGKQKKEKEKEEREGKRKKEKVTRAKLT